MALSSDDSLSVWCFLFGFVPTDDVETGERDLDRDDVSILRRLLVVNVEYCGGPGTVGGKL